MSASGAGDARRFGRSALAGLLSMLLPGLGQLLVGARRRGLVLLGVSTLLLALMLWQGLHRAAGVLDLLIRPGGPTVALTANALLALFRVYAALDALRVGLGDDGLQRSGRRTALTLGMGAALVAFALAPHALAVHYGLVAQDTLRSVFATPQAAPAAGAPERAGWGHRGAGGAPTPEAHLPTAEHRGLPSEHGDAANPWLEHERLTIALLGSDAAPGRPGARLDALLVVSVQPDSGQVAIFSVERHLRDFPLPERLHGPWEWHCRDVAPGWDLLNGLYRCGDEVIPHRVAELYPEAPDPAAAAVSDTLGELLGLPVHHYVLLDMAGFVELVDAVGGVELDLDGSLDAEPSRSADECDWRAFDVRPEARRLDGAAALDLVRERTGTSAADRMGRQRCLLVSLADQLDTPTVLRRFERLAAVTKEHVATSIPLDDAPGLVDLLSRVDADQIITVGFGRPAYVSAGGRPHVEPIRARVEEAVGPGADDAADD